MKLPARLSTLSILLAATLALVAVAVILREPNESRSVVAAKVPRTERPMLIGDLDLKPQDLKPDERSGPIRLSLPERTPEETAAWAMLPFALLGVCAIVAVALRDTILARAREESERRAREQLAQRERIEWSDLEAACIEFRTATALSEHTCELRDLDQLAGLLPLLVGEGTLEPDVAVILERSTGRLKVTPNGRLATRKNEEQRKAYLANVHRQRACAKYQLLEAFRSVTANDARTN